MSTCQCISFKTGAYFRLKCSTLAVLSPNVMNKFNCLRDANCLYVGYDYMPLSLQST